MCVCACVCALAQAENEAGDKVPMPELQHNLQLLVDLAESNIRTLDNKLRHEQDSATLLAREKKRLEDEVRARGAGAMALLSNQAAAAASG